MPPLSREEIYEKHEALRRAEMRGADSAELALLANTIDAGVRLRDAIGDENYGRAMEIAGQMRANGDLRPPAEIFHDLATVAGGADVVLNDHELANALRFGNEQQGLHAIGQLRPGMPDHQARQILNDLQLGDEQQQKAAYTELADFVPSEENDTASYISWRASQGVSR